MPSRADVISKAREYVGTPFQHLARVNGRGIDCVGLLLCVADDLGIKDTSGAPLLRGDYPDYSHQPVGTFVQDECRRRLTSKSISDLKPGDVVTLRVPTDPCHVAIISERGGHLYMVHAYSAGEQKCVEHVLSPQWRRRIVGVFSLPQVTE